MPKTLILGPEETFDLFMERIFVGGIVFGMKMIPGDFGIKCVSAAHVGEYSCRGCGATQTYSPCEYCGREFNPL